jgi:hypothetical protein
MKIFPTLKEALRAEDGEAPSALSPYNLERERAFEAFRLRPAADLEREALTAAPADRAIIRRELKRRSARDARDAKRAAKATPPKGGTK